MSSNQLKNLNRERDNLKIAARDLDETDDPLRNILRNVMTNDFYARNKKGEPESP